MLYQTFDNCPLQVQLEHVFNAFDTDKIGFITREVLCSILLSLAYPVSEEGLDEMMVLGDRRGVGRLTKNDFVQLMTNKRKWKDRVDVNKFVRGFLKLDFQ